MKFLTEYNISLDEIDQIKKVNSSGVINNIIYNKDNVVGIINYLIDLGVLTEAIRNIFIYQIGLYFRTLDEIKEAFNEYEIDSIIKSLNYDVNTIDLIEFN